jgi:hypothetical protein
MLTTVTPMNTEQDTNSEERHCHVIMSQQLKQALRQQAGARDMGQSEYIRTLIREDRKRNPPEDLVIEDD